MTPKMRMEIQRLRKHLAGESWTIYRKLIGRLAQDHKQFDFTTPISGLLRNGDVRGLVALADSLSEQKYSDATQHFVANQFAALIKKYPFPNSEALYEPEKKALEKFLYSESLCKRTNEKFLSPFFTGGDWNDSLHRMRAFIKHVIGLEPNLASIWSKCDFGPGANIGTHGNATNIARKLSGSWSVSPSAFAYARAALLSNWQLSELVFRSVDGVSCVDPISFERDLLERVAFVTYNKIAFVPKTVKTKRSIAVEPLWNGFVQKGIDVYMRDCLKRVGLDLTDQAINSRMARLGSYDESEDSFVTIDLSSASDSVSIGLCREVLPPEWFAFLDANRSKNYRIQANKEVRYEKFCSMGNGFCFPLETLLFASMCSSIGCGTAGVDFTVYGDDIIVRKKFAEPLIALLGFCGFEVNNDKTFLSGPFRESCGTDWYHGDDVRPFTLDFALDSLEALFKFLNLSERSSRCVDFFSGVRPFIKSLIPPTLRFCRPFPGNADSGYSVGLDEFMSSPFAVWSRDLQCWSWLELIHSAVPDKGWRELRYASTSHMIAALRGSSSEKPFVMRRETRTNVRRVAHG